MKHVDIRDIKRRIGPHRPHLDETIPTLDMHIPDSDFEPGSGSRTLRVPIEIDRSNWIRHWFHDTARHVWTWCPSADLIGVLVVHDGHD